MCQGYSYGTDVITSNVPRHEEVFVHTDIIAYSLIYKQLMSTHWLAWQYITYVCHILKICKLNTKHTYTPVCHKICVKI